MICVNRQSGFTLVELVAATTLTVLIAGSTVAILRSTGAVRQRVNAQTALQHRARTAVTTIATALRNAYRSGGDQGVLEGTNAWADDTPADRVRFFTVSRRTIRQGQPESDVRECEFFLCELTEDMPPVLMQRIDSTRNEKPDGGGVVRCVAENIVGMDLAYHDGQQWQDEWPEQTKGWPIAIRIRLAVLGEAGPTAVWTTSRIVNFPRRPGARKQEQRDKDKE